MKTVDPKWLERVKKDFANSPLLPSPPDSRDFTLSSVVKAEKPTPRIAKLPQSPIKIDQGNLPKCAGSAIAGIYNAYYNAIGELPKGGFSDDYAYQRAKQLDGIPDLDGTYLRIVLMIALHEGICSKAVWDKYKRLCHETIADAKKYKIKAYAKLTGLSEIKQAIADGKYLLLGSQVTTDWTKPPTKEDGYIGFPPQGHFVGGHATYAYGYDDLLRNVRLGYILGENSWGPGWGDDGTYQMPQDFVGYTIDLGMAMLMEVWAVEFPMDVPVVTEREVEMTVGEQEVYLNGEKITIDQSPVVDKNTWRTMVPIRAIGEMFGFDVKYDEKTKKITIKG